MVVSWSYLPSYLSYLPSYLSYLWLVVRVGRSCERPLKESIYSYTP